MKIKNIESALKKINVTLKISDTRLEAVSQLGFAVLEAWKNRDSEEVEYVRIRYAADKDDTMTDYFAGSTYHTIKGIVAAFERMDQSSNERINLAKSKGLKKIELIRHEGESHLCDIVHTFNSVKELNDFIISQCHTYPTMGYDKHSLRITFNDDFIYGERLDLQHFANKYYKFTQCDFMAHLNDYKELLFKFKRENAQHFNPEELARLLNTIQRLNECEAIKQLKAV